MLMDLLNKVATTALLGFVVSSMMAMGVGFNMQTGSSTAGQGERPGGTAAVERTMTATISDVDKSASSITFIGPNGWKYSRRVVDPTVLDKIKIGDQVDITWDTAQRSRVKSVPISS